MKKPKLKKRLLVLLTMAGAVLAANAAVTVTEQDQGIAHATLLPGFPGEQWGIARHVNERNRVVGQARTIGIGPSKNLQYEHHAVVWDKQAGVWQMKDLGLESNARQNSQSVEVNAAGQVCGFTYRENIGDARAFFWEDGMATFQLLPQPANDPSDFSLPLDMNNNGELKIVGYRWSGWSGAQRKATYWKRDLHGVWHVTDLHPLAQQTFSRNGRIDLSQIDFINENGWVIGRASGNNADYQPFGFAWKEGFGIIDLTAVTDQRFPWLLANGTDLNEDNTFAGSVRDPGSLGGTAWMFLPAIWKINESGNTATIDFKYYPAGGLSQPLHGSQVSASGLAISQLPAYYDFNSYVRYSVQDFALYGINSQSQVIGRQYLPAISQWRIWMLDPRFGAVDLGRGSGWAITDSGMIRVFPDGRYDLAEAIWHASVQDQGAGNYNIHLKKWLLSGLQGESFNQVMAMNSRGLVVGHSLSFRQAQVWEFEVVSDGDNDGASDDQDNCPGTPNPSQEDTDSDGAGDACDEDDDADGVPDAADAFPLNRDESADTDADGIGNNADADDDNDGVADASDAFPLDASESVDSDGDGVGNNADTDDDGDGAPDGSDAFPLNPAESVDTDSDGIGNNADADDDNDSVADASDAFPLDASESVDTDGDGVGNIADTDDDGDGVSDGSDAFPLNPAESVDTDRDGIGNNADPDDDNDGVADASDAFPLDASESVDTDGDGVGNNADTDDDGDGVSDGSDAFPLNPAESVDTDSDGVGNNADPDDDNDGILDAADLDNTPISGYISVLGVPTTISDRPLATGIGLGKSLAEKIALARMGAKNHGQFVSAMAKYLGSLTTAGVITQAEASLIQSIIARSDIGKK